MEKAKTEPASQRALNVLLSLMMLLLSPRSCVEVSVPHSITCGESEKESGNEGTKNCFLW